MTDVDEQARLVCEAAETGNIAILEELVRQCRRKFPPDVFCTMFGPRKDADGRTCTPLVSSAKSNHLKVVEFLVKSCGVDVEATGTVRFSGDVEDIQGAPPLWTAATAGHLPVVQFLVEAGARINHATATESTPLRGACFDGHLEVVRYLLQQKANIDAPNNCGQTPLMVAAGRGHLPLVKFLLDHGADSNKKTKEGYSVLHIVASAERGTTEILKCLERAGARPELTHDGWTVGFLAATAGHESMVEYIVHKPETPIRERAEILELCGSVLFDKSNLVSSAMQMWQRAMAIRCEHNLLLTLDQVLAPMKAYDYKQEALTPSDLVALQSDRHSLEMHSLLARERIIGERRSTAFYIRRRGLRYSSARCYEWTMNLWLHALEMHKRIVKPGDPDLRAILLNCTNTFKDMIAHKYHPSMKVFFKWGLDDVIQSQPETEHRSKMMSILLNFLGVWLDTDCNELGSEWCERAALIKRLVEADIRDRQGHSFLHLACSNTTAEGNYYKLCEFPNLGVVSSLLQCGADPNVINLSKETPLHCFAKSLQFSGTLENTVDCILSQLVSFGAMTSCRDKEKRTALSVLLDSEGDVGNLVSSHIVVAFRSISHQALCLQSLAASAIVDYGISYEFVLPVGLKQYVDLH